MNPTPVPGPAPRSLLITVLGWLIAIGGALFSVISFFALLMLLVGKDGTQTSDVTGFFLVVVAPPLTAFAGLGLALRWRWAWYYLVAALACVVLWNVVDMATHSEPSVTTTVSPSGVKTTTYRGGAAYSLPALALAAGLLVVLLLPRARREFAASPRPPTLPSLHQAIPANPIPPAPAEPEGTRDWRVGHQGRDQMYYEERHAGTWQRINLDGEMLMGRAHHVIYFPTATDWKRLPEWARHRRTEIIARIKMEFREPDYEYTHDGAEGVAAVVPSPFPFQPKPAHRALPSATPKQMLALIGVVVLLLGFGGFMGGKLVGGLDSQTVTLPIPRASLQRPVLYSQEPTLFWFSLGIYGVVSAGSLALAGWLSVQGWKAWRGR